MGRIDNLADDQRTVAYFLTPVGVPDVGTVSYVEVDTLNVEDGFVVVEGVNPSYPAVTIRAAVPWRNILGISQTEEREVPAPAVAKGDDGLTDDERRKAKAEQRDDDEEGVAGWPGSSTPASSTSSETTSGTSTTATGTPSTARTTAPRSTPDQTEDRSARSTGGDRKAGK